MPAPETVSTATALPIKATILAAKWVGVARRRALATIASKSDDINDAEIAFLRDRIEQPELQVAILRQHVGKHARSPRYTLTERLHVLWFMEYFQIPRRRVGEYFGIARSTLYRWLRRIDDASPAPQRTPSNRTPTEVAALVWEIAPANNWGRVRIAAQLGLLGVFLAASTVRNILSRSEPPKATPDPSREPEADCDESRTIPASFPNHVWSIDTTTVLRRGLWPTHVFVAIDHFSRKVVAATPLGGPNAGWICTALEEAFTAFGPPRHILSDKHPTFQSAAIKELLRKWRIKHRFGAVGNHGSIAVTERVIWTLKYEWLFQVPLIKGFDHVTLLCDGFANWYNAWCPHMTLSGARPDDVYRRDLPESIARNAKVVPHKIERHHFPEARVTGFRLPKAA